LKRTLRAGALEYEVWLLRQAADASPRHSSLHSARSFLDRFARDPGNLVVIRDLLRQEFSQSCFGASDQQVLDRLAGLIAAGRLRLVPLPTSPVSPTSKHFARVLGPIAEPEKPAKVIDSSAHWIHLLIVDDETGDPVSNVTVSLKLPSGEIKQFTTDGEGRIRVQGLPPGSWDLEQMEGEDAIDVVKSE
jgi:hypothetical protein